MIDALPPPALRSDTPEDFIAKEDAWRVAMVTFAAQADAAALAMNLNSTTDTSASSVAIGTGAKSFTVSAGKSFLGGMFLVFADAAAPATNWMLGQATSYAGTTLNANILAVGGSGTKASWLISQTTPITTNESRGSAAMHATTMDLWAQPNVIDGTSAAVTVTAIANAPQAGARRTLYPVAGSIITNGATFAVDGATSATAAAGDKWEFEAITTSTYKVHITKSSGMAPVPRQIQPISASVGGNALTISASALTLDFRSTALGSGAISTVSGTPSNLVISSGSTLGTVSAQQSRIAVLALNNAGTIELAAVNLAGGTNIDETGVISTTAEGGAGAADSATVIYSTTARSNVAYRVIGYIESTQATAGTWATSPSTIQGAGGNALTAMSGLGYGQTWQSVTRNSGATYYNTTGKPIAITSQSTSTSSSSETSIALTVNGAAVGYLMRQYSGAVGAQSAGERIIPAGASYMLTDLNIAAKTIYELR